MKNSIVNIESVSNNSFGTGFVIDSDENGIYVLTCKHVLEDVVHPMVEDVLAKVVATGVFIDMVVLHVSKLDLPVLALQKECCHNLKVEVIGFSSFSHASLQKEHIDATLYKEHIEIHSKKDDKFYTVRKIKALDGFNFERGNSGSPVICKKTKKVIAMVSNKEGSSLAYAVNIDNVLEIWKDAPKSLFSEKKTKPIEEIVVEKLEPIINFTFPWKKVLVALFLPILLFILYKTLGEKQVWIDPEKSVCIKKGGKVDGNGFCFATWREAQQVCLSSGGVLPSINMLKEVVLDCNGVLDNVDEEESRSETLACYKGKGFLLNRYWSETSYDASSAWGIHFGDGEKYMYKYGKSSYGSPLYFRCEKVGD